MIDFINTGLLAMAFLALFAFAEWLRAKEIAAELTRKMVHIGTGFITLLIPILLDNHWFVLALSTSFFIILLVSFKYKFLESINGVQRQSVGSLAYPMSVYLCYWGYIYHDKQLLFFFIPMLLLAICDPIAALMGKNFPFGAYRIGSLHKTFSGAAMFFVSAVVVIFVTSVFLKVPFEFKTILLTALFATVAEGISGKGTDNLTIPMATLLFLTFYLK